MKHKFFIVLVLCISASFTSFAGPGTYYNSIDTNQSCTSLKTILFNLISSNTTVIPYSSIDNYYNLTDSKPSELGAGETIVDRYCSENPNGLDYCDFRYPGSFCLTTPSDTNQCVCYNKEHTFPKSWFGSTVYPMYSDLHFIWPADNRINLYKSNFPIGYAKNNYFTSRNGTSVGQSDATKNFGYNNSNVFEPIDSFKGDFARAYLYVITRYQDSLPFWISRSTSNNVLDGNKYPGLDAWILQLCIKWNKADPPSAFEMKRNDAVYLLQGNRNPYIDHPNWAEKIFGVNGISSSCVATGIKTARTIKFSVYPNPVESILNVKAQFIPGDATIEVSDLMGRKLDVQNIIRDNEVQSIDVSHLAKGIYFVNVIADGISNVSSFIKQ